MSSELVTRARDGDAAALETLIGKYQQPVGRYVVSQIGQGEDYLNLCQVIFVKMVRGLPRLRSPELFEAWLFRIARSTCTDHLRQRQLRRGVFEPLAEGHSDVAATVAEKPAAFDTLQAAFERLPESQRALLDLSIEQRRSYEELARLTNLSVAAVRNRLFRVRARLRKMISEEERR